MATDLGLPTGVDPDAIRLKWRQARGNMPSTATMNFIVYVEHEEYRDWVFERAQRIADKHPSRMIVLDAVKDRHGAQTQTRELRSDGLSVFRERVDLGVDGVRAAQRLHLVEALLVRDVPVMLWWAADRLFTSNTFSALMGIARQVILDSSGTGTDVKAIREFAAFFSGGHRVKVRDLAWMRLDPWRDVVAQFFDDPALRAELYKIRRLSITSGSDAEALYLGTWLATRLGWNFSDHHTFRDRLGAEIAFERSRDGGIRRVQSVVIETETSKYSAYVSGEDAIALEVTGENARSIRHVPLQAIDNTSLVERAILTSGSEEIFEESLAKVGGLLG